ncbi:MAG: fibronectin type III domain-containing protein [bacterium]
MEEFWQNTKKFLGKLIGSAVLLFFFIGIILGAFYATDLMQVSKHTRQVVNKIVQVVEVFADTTTTLRPTADGGNDSVNWVNQAANTCNTINCYLEVDENSSDNDTSYIQSGTNGAIQTFDIDESGIPNNSVITQINIIISNSRQQVGALIQARYCVDGSCFNSGTNIRPGVTYTSATQSFTGLSITKNASTDIEIGVLNNAVKDVRVSQISTVITYTPAGDTTAPAAVINLAASSPTTDSINLSWTAPGDDNNTGTATTYDVRYSTATIDDGNWASATQATGEPTPSIAGSSESMTVSGLSAEITYYFAIKTSDEVPNTSALSNVPSLATSAITPITGLSIPSSGGGGVPPTKVLFSGQAYPMCKIEILQRDDINPTYRNIPLETSKIDEQGNFSIEYLAFLTGNYFFALRAKDKDGRETGILSFNVNFRSENELIAEDIFVPPTFGFKQTAVTKGSDLIVEGYVAPSSTIAFFIDDNEKGKTVSDDDGYYNLSLSTKSIDIGQYYLRAKQINNDRESDLSFPRAFRVTSLAYPKADFNNDNEVNIVDWSIFLFRWGSDDMDLRNNIDLDGNGIVDIFDFSIFLIAMVL